MSNRFFDYAAPRDDLPDYLYRVYHRGSFNQYSYDSGFRDGIHSGKPTFRMKTDEQALEALEDHLDVGNRSRPTPFVSVYEERGQAIRLIERLQGQGKRDIRVAIVYMDRVKANVRWAILDVWRAAEYLEIELSPGAIAMTNSEHLFLRLIPFEAIGADLSARRFIECSRYQ